MDKSLRIAAMAANALLLLAMVFLWHEAHVNEPHEYLLMMLLFACPALSLLALRSGPDAEERRLLRQVHKAELRKRLKELEESN
jgi:hypothetical protein